MAIGAVARRHRRGRSASTSQLHVLRNHTVGSTWMVSASGPAFVTRTVIKRSSGLALA